MSNTGFQNKDWLLFQHYLSVHSPEANRWNGSPQNLYIEYRIRHFTLNEIHPFPGMKVCNIGIGVGEWDDFLGYWLEGKGRLTSIDINPEICEIFAYRQQREQHPNPSEVICQNALRLEMKECFDLVTIIGSTVKESGDYEGMIQKCFDLAKRGGLVLYMDFERYHSPERFENYLAENHHHLVKVHKDQMTELPFYIFLARKNEFPSQTV